ncbi:KEOPS complex subunit Cgi121 [Halopenitus persicus]|uniref:KEOPS complex subunit Cgi121 n=1 Tax=Halopenitus persicus TaxID=1048396 RepID=UPI000BBAD521|nr:KEOPS complex subunit Cgi121 [Halopenitus persicus]
MSDDRSNPATTADDDEAAVPDDDEAAVPDDDEAAVPDDDEAAVPDDDEAAVPDDGPAGVTADDRPVPHLIAGDLVIEDLDAFLETVRTLREETGAVIQVVDARYVVSRTHLDRAVARAERAIDRDEAVASDRAVEVLLYAAGRRQIDEALEMGVDEGETTAIAVVYLPNAAPRRVSKALDRLERRFDAATVHPPDDRQGFETWLAAVTDPERVRSFHDVTDAELEATLGTLADVVEERVALLDVEK